MHWQFYYQVNYRTVPCIVCTLSSEWDEGRQQEELQHMFIHHSC